ncbi:thioredoxin family protein [Mucilaginibacter gynuensis]|uniref:Thioredoxin family protein n=1 Tax=Mucilaginibacter gynuensis TaxID=1302236 RepID=A0ABP8G6W0_9SPHI
MTLKAYIHYFKSVLNGVELNAPYDNPEYLNYVRLNCSRHQRWMKIGDVDPDLEAMTDMLNEPQKWIFITEPWCGDAAHILPFVVKLTQDNPMIDLEIQRRDHEPFLIERYLTGTSRSIPKLIIREKTGTDLLVWGPRPKRCQALYDRLKNNQEEDGKLHIDIQNWYNKDKGISFQRELLGLMKKVSKIRY